jgi:hypothetical protein
MNDTADKVATTTTKTSTTIIFCLFHRQQGVAVSVQDVDLKRSISGIHLSDF